MQQIGKAKVGPAIPKQMFDDLSLECRALNDIIEKQPFIC